MKKPFYGWWIVGMAFAANFLSVGANFYIFNAIMEPLTELHPWTRADINRALMIGTLIGFFSLLIYGTLVMRVGPRILMTIGALVAGAAFMLMGRASELWQFYLVYVVMFLGNSALGGIVANTAVNNWFIKKRGSALGLATAGISLTGVFTPVLAMILIQRMSLAQALFWMGLCLALAAPASWLIIRNRPEEHGLVPDGQAPETAAPPEAGEDKIPVIVISEPIWSPGQAARTGAFWKIGLAYALVMIGIVGVMSQLKPRFCDIGYDDSTAMTMMAAAALLGALGKYLWGSMCDRFEPRRVAATLMAANALGLGFGLLTGSETAQVVFVIIFGFAMGGAMSTFPVIIGHYFGRESFASIARFLGLFLGLQLLGYGLMGQSYESTGSYDRAYVIFLALDIVAAALIFSLRKNPPSPIQSPAQEPASSGAENPAKPVDNPGKAFIIDCTRGS